MFRLTCPKCGAGPDEANLQVVSGNFRASKMWLRRDGFAAMDAKTFDTDEEVVYCGACGARFPLGDCLDEGPVPSFEPFKGYDWSELAARFGVDVTGREGLDDVEPLVVWIESHRLWENERIAKTCREFLAALIAVDPTANKPVWKGLAKVKDDGTFMDFFIHLLEWMWT